MKERLYLAYGSNLNICQMHYRCPGAKIVGTTEIEGYELLFKGSQTGAYLTIEEKERSKVPAAVWATTAADEVALDRYEGCPIFYYKREMKLPVKDIKTGEIQQRSVYVYIMHEERKCGLPSWNYIEICLEGYRDFHLPEKFLWQAVEETRRRIHEAKSH